MSSGPTEPQAPTDPTGPKFCILREGHEGRRVGETDSARLERLREEVPWMYKDYTPRPRRPRGDR